MLLADIESNIPCSRSKWSVKSGAKTSTTRVAVGTVILFAILGSVAMFDNQYFESLEDSCMTRQESETRDGSLKPAAGELRRLVRCAYWKIKRSTTAMTATAVTSMTMQNASRNYSNHSSDYENRSDVVRSEGSDTTHAQGRCYSPAVIGKYCSNREVLQSAFHKSHAECRSLCDAMSNCSGFDFYPTFASGHCQLFSNTVCTLLTSSYNQAMHYMVVNCEADADQPIYYLLGALSSNNCPNATASIKTADECRTAGDSIGGRWGGTQDDHLYPMGCYANIMERRNDTTNGTNMSSLSAVFRYNSHTKGGRHYASAPVCRSDEAGTTWGKIDMSTHPGACGADLAITSKEECEAAINKENKLLGSNDPVDVVTISYSFRPKGCYTGCYSDYFRKHFCGQFNTHEIGDPAYVDDNLFLFCRQAKNNYIDADKNSNYNNHRDVDGSSNYSHDKDNSTDVDTNGNYTSHKDVDATPATISVQYDYDFYDDD